MGNKSLCQWTWPFISALLLSILGTFVVVVAVIALGPFVMTVFVFRFQLEINARAQREM